MKALYYLKELSGSLGRTAVNAAGLLALVAAFSGVALAGFGPAPELDPGSMANALMLLSGSLLIATGRRRRK